ncbi:MAG: ParB/RepB/Spo0J family partition protein [Nitrospirae bacterium]|nr:ParB/RepB/Spo0J family partition protein [Nitrospirota bacterium]MCL5421434.1 ParB/RepB/Spo0J family partition protein [Nitrospirota bacterium]
MKTALGKGLESLLPDKTQEIINIDITRIIPGDQQPRKVFKDAALQDLAASIKEKGVLQPIIVSRTGDGTFRLIAGERRWRASSLAGLKKIPAIVKDVASADSLEIALIENIQREDLNPVETAEAFHRLMKDFSLTQEELSAKVGKDRATVANYLRLLKLPDEIKKFVNDGSLSMGHARAVLSIEGKANQLEAARRIIHKGLSVRETETLAKKWSSETKKRTARHKKDPQIESLQEKLIRSLGTKVRIHHKGKKGKIEIEYYSLDELDRLLDILMGEGS